jgi:hypothetical protein
MTRPSDLLTPDDREGSERAVPQSAAPYLPARRSLSALQRALQTCQGCELYKRATQAVAGEGPRSARLVLVGEAPGDLDASALLRAPDAARRDQMRQEFISDLKVAVRLLS